MLLPHDSECQSQRQTVSGMTEMVWCLVVPVTTQAWRVQHR